MGVSTVAVHRCAACSNGTGCDAGSNCAPMHWHTHATGVHRTHARTSTHFRGQNGAFQHTRAVSWCHGPWHSTEHTSSRACRYRLQPAPGYRLSPSARHCHVHIRARQTPACACSGQATAALATVGALAGGDHGEARTAARRARRAATTGTTAAASLVTLMAAAASMVGTRVADSDCCPHQWIVARGPETKRGERVCP